MKKKKNKPTKALLLGLGLDNQDGHVRVTQGDNFRLYGGSEETHGTMQEKAIKLNEHLKRRGKQLEELSPQEFQEISHKVGITTPSNSPPSGRN
jgi:hypothetical protein